MSCPTDYLNKQKVQTHDAFSSIPNNIAVNKLYLSHMSKVDHKGLIISSVKEGSKTENKISLKLQHSSNFGFLQLSYKGPKFHNYFSPDSTVIVSEILLKKSITKKNKFSLEDIHNGSWDIVHIITRKKSDCNYLFEKAIKDKYTVILAILLEIIDANNSSRQFALYLNGINGPLLHRAVAQKDIKIIETLLKCKLDINAKNKAGWTPLLVAVDSELSDVTDLLISNGANLNAKNSELQVPLHYAVKINSNSKILNSLIKSQAKLNVIDKDGQTPLHYSVIAGNANIVDILLKEGANYKLEDKLHRTPLHLALQQKNLDIIKVFLKHKVDANILNSRRQTPLFYLIEKPFRTQLKTVNKETYSTIIDAFLQNGAKINFQDSKGRTPLYNAVVNDKVECVQALLEHDADVTIQDEFGRSVLHEACQWSRNKCIQVLLKFNIDIDVTDIRKNTVLHVAVATKNYSTVELLLKKNPNINMSDALGKTALHLALESGHLPIIELLLKNKADVNLKDASGRIPLHIALKNPKITITIIKSILNSTNDINAVDNYEKTLLHVAAEEANYTAFKLILERNPNINMVDSLKRTTLHCALEYVSLPIVELLLKNKADVNLRDESGRIALHVASQNPNISINIIESILNSTNDIHAKNDLGGTAVHYAAYNHNVKTIKYLIERNADVNAKDSDGRTPLHIAVDPENEYTSCLKCVKTFLDYNADVNAVDKDLISPLHLACFAKNAEVIKCLIKNGADASMRDKHGRTVFHYACMLGLNEKLLWVDNDEEEHIEDTLNILVEQNISVNCVDIFGKTPLHYAAEYNWLFFVSKLLLNIGADINIVDNDHNTAFDYVISVSVHIYDFPNELFLLYAKHIVQMKVMKLWVQEQILDNIYKVNNDRHLEWIQRYERVCIEENDIMKTTNLDQSNITYYDFLKKHPHDVVNYTRNQNIVKAIQSNGLVHMFPVYRYFLKNHLHEVLCRSYLYEKIQESLQTYVFEKLPTLCMGEILRYLNNSELAMFLDAIKPVVLLK